MVRKIKKVKKRKKTPQGTAQRPTWTVPFDDEGQAAVYIHKHGDTDDHSNCGPVVMCCARAAEPYRKLAPDLHGRVAELKPQWGDHLTTWLDRGVQAMYFVLCDPDDPEAIYQFGLSAEHARPLLTGKIPHSAYRLPERRFVAPSV